MPIDPRIAMGVQPLQLEMPNPSNQMNMLAQALQVKSGMSQMQEAEQARAERNALNEAYKGALGADGAVDRNVLFRSLADRNLGAKIPALQKQFAEADKATADVGSTKANTAKAQLEAAHKRVDLAGQSMGWLRQNPTSQNAAQVVQYLVANEVWAPEQAQAILAKIQADPSPQNVAQFAEMSFRAALGAKEQLPKFQTNNIGGQTVTQALDPVSGKATVTSAMQNTQSPDNAASVAATMRGQNMTDARARELNNINKEAARTQVIESPQGVMLVDKGTGQVRPATMNGQPLPGKPSAATEKELVGIRQQNAIIDGALAAVDKTPSAFSFARGGATMAGAIPESLAGRMDSDPERQARSYVFNNVSKVINERAGAAQSAQELARLRSFLPAETDNAAQIKSKLQAFKTYLGDMEAGTKGTKGNGATGGWSIQKVN